MISDHEQILYIGKAKNLRKRLIYYTSEDLPKRLMKMTELVHLIEYTITPSETEAILLEARLIRTHKPKYNILLKDDKSFPRILLRMDHDFPQLLKYRSKDTPDIGKSFGPFASSDQINATMDELQKIFKLRSCSDSSFALRKRPCMQYQIKRCLAPCVGKVSKDDYLDIVKQAEDFLSGKTKELQANLAQKMEEYSLNLEYEKAAIVRDRIKALSYTQLKYGTQDFANNNTDILVLVRESDTVAILVAFYKHKQFYGYKIHFLDSSDDESDTELIETFAENFYNSVPAPEEIITNIPLKQLSFDCKITSPIRGDKKDIMDNMVITAKERLGQKIRDSIKKHEIFLRLQQLFKLPNVPERIEVYDNSHIMGKYPVGAMIVAKRDGFDKKEYRAYNLESLSGEGDDYKMIKEVINRRIVKIKSGEISPPDLMIIDGGRGHMSVVKNVMEIHQYHVPFVCMSKGPDRNAGREIFHSPVIGEISLNKEDELMKFLQILRDEAHNHAIKTHRKKRAKSFTFSSLDEIDGIGQSKKRDLLNSFGSIESIKNASISELSQIPGVGHKLAQKIFEHFKGR
jgi:excinuclease ABC subunit C